MSIPLTIDWLTLTWLKLRLDLWLKRRRFPLLVLGLWALLSGCVPVTRFEEAQSAAQVEMAGRHQAEARLQQQQAENAELQARLSQQGARLEEREQALAQAELQGSVEGKQREEAAGMVEQLRGELARTAGHLQAFQDDKQKLEASRGAETERAQGLARLSRDVALLLGAQIATGEYALDAESGRVVLRAPRSQVLAEDGSAKPEAEPLLKAVARVLQLNPFAKLRVEDSSARGDALAVSRLVAALGERAVGAERFEPLAVAPEGTPEGAAESEPAAADRAPPASASAELTFGFSVP